MEGWYKTDFVARLKHTIFFVSQLPVNFVHQHKDPWPTLL